MYAKYSIPLFSIFFVDYCYPKTCCGCLSLCCFQHRTCFVVVWGFVLCSFCCLSFCHASCSKLLLSVLYIRLLQRKKTILHEFQTRDKANVFLDHRFGEGDETLNEEEKAIMRFQRERQVFISRSELRVICGVSHLLYWKKWTLNLWNLS
jgi:hypothetical protein